MFSRSAVTRTPPLNDAVRIHVAAAVLEDAQRRILLSRRADDAHQGGLWEFPGGKLDAGEDPESALRRELEEELGVAVETARPLIRVSHDYADRGVLLDVWKVTGWRGEPRGLEGQAITWAHPDALDPGEFPAADVPVIAAARLPDRYAVTPEPEGSPGRLLEGIDRITRGGIRLVQLRVPGLGTGALSELARAAARVCEGNGARLLVNAEPDLARAVGAHGVHLNSARLLALTSRPAAADFRVGASCHDARELEHAARIGADFALLSPVRATPGHGKGALLGWEGFKALAEPARLPVFALGGLGPGDLEQAWRHGAQGVAGIRGFWD